MRNGDAITIWITGPGFENPSAIAATESMKRPHPLKSLLSARSEMRGDPDRTKSES